MPQRPATISADISKPIPATTRSAGSAGLLVSLQGVVRPRPKRDRTPVAGAYHGAGPLRRSDPHRAAGSRLRHFFATKRTAQAVNGRTWREGLRTPLASPPDAS